MAKSPSRRPPPAPDKAPVDDYWSLTTQPLYNLIFLFPILLVYEGAVIWSLRQGWRPPVAGAQVWMTAALEWLGYEGLYLPPLIIVVILIGWHVVDGRQWRVRPKALAGMLGESLLLALVLVSLMYGVLGLMGVQRGVLRPTAFRYVVMYLGAGIYEETLFRLLLLPAVYGLGLLAGLGKKPAAVVAIVGSAMLFAVAHHVGPAGEPWAVTPLVWRSVGGVFFAVVFVTRGFGIAVGAHAAFDILVG